jgi:hypothetical protein
MSSNFQITFPNEMVDYTVDFLYSDIEALRACSLTSKTFRLAAIHHLFASLHLLFLLPHAGAASNDKRSTTTNHRMQMAPFRPSSINLATRLSPHLLSFWIFPSLSNITIPNITMIGTAPIMFKIDVNVAGP